jgi:thiol-disulfide isomerase/thioredoxin
VSRGPRIALAVLLVVAAGPAGFFAYKVLVAGHAVPAPLARAGLAAATASTSAPVLPDEAAAPRAAQQAVPEQLPELSFPDRDGMVRKLSDFRGRPVIVNFWATWCEPCRREIPLLESLRRASSARLQVVGIAVDDRDPVLKYAHTIGIDYPVLIAGEDGGLAALGTLGMQGELPFTVFADGKGRIVGVKLGELHPEEARFIVARLLDLDSGRLALGAARDQISSELKTLAVERAQRSTSATAGPAS